MLIINVSEMVSNVTIASILVVMDSWVQVEDGFSVQMESCFVAIMAFLDLPSAKALRRELDTHSTSLFFTALPMF